MKKLLLAPLLLSFSALADPTYNANEIEIVGGGITYHLWDGNNYSPYAHALTSNGRVILNPLAGVKFEHIDKESGTYFSLIGFGGDNSVSQPIYGGMYSMGYHYKFVDLGIVGGGYMQDDRPYTAAGFTTISVGPANNAMVPIVGVEVNFIIPLDNETYLRQSNIITPAITNHTIGFGIRF